MMPAEIGENKLALLAAAAAVLGLIFLFYYAQQMQPKQVAIGEIARLPENEYVEAIGTVRSASSRNGNININLCDYQACALVFVPANNADDLRLNPYLIKAGDRLVVRGMVGEYKGEKEIIPAAPDGIELV